MHKRLPAWEKIRISVCSQFGRKQKGMVGDLTPLGSKTTPRHC